tara:strand:+ start:812 stop:2422 length:1611 start_codon:yes stop_codon:yes gene_type:complete
MEFLLKSDLRTFSQSSNWKQEFRKLINESKYLDTSIVNGIRRYSIGKLNTVAFDYSPTPQLKEYITFEKNNSNMNNDFIGHRIGLLPVDIIGVKYVLLIYKILLGHHNEIDKYVSLLKENKKANKEACTTFLKSNLKLSDNIELINNIEFYFDEKNTTEDYKNITSEDIKMKLYLIGKEPEDKIELDLNDTMYKTKLDNYKVLFEVYEEYYGLDKVSSDLNYNKLVRNIFKLYANKYGVLLCKLKKTEQLKCKMYLNIGNGEKHSRWSVVSPCTYSFILDYDLITKILNKKIESNKLKLTNTNLQELVGDEFGQIQEFIENRYTDITTFELNKELIELKDKFLEEKKELQNIDIITQFISEKDKLINIFNKCDNQRYFKGKEEYELFNREFKLYIESVGFYNNERILHKTFKLLKQDLIQDCTSIIFLLKNFNTFPYKNNEITIDESVKIQNGVDIIFNNSNHGLGNIFSSYIYYLYDTDTIEYVGYKMTHPLKTEMVITIGLNDIKNVNTVVVSIFENLKKIFTNMHINNFYKNE